jgi:hypothetical protein
MVASHRSMEKACGRSQITRKNRFVRFYLPLLWGADRRRKIGGFTVPVAAANHIVSPGGRPHTTKIGRGHTGNESKKVRHTPGTKFMYGPGK